MTIALFPCKANPPHIGHIRTLLRIKDDYEKIIVSVLDVNLVISPQQVIEILKEILKYFPVFSFNIHKESLTKTIPEDLPKFDIILTGNQKVYDNAVKNGIKAKLIPRTPVYKGNFMRGAYLKGVEHDKKTKLGLL